MVKEMITVWCTKHALTKGVEYLSGYIVNNSFYCKEYFGFHGEGEDWHRTKEQAIARAEQMRLNKIKALKKQIEKLEKLSFK